MSASPGSESKFQQNSWTLFMKLMLFVNLDVLINHMFK